MITFKKHGYTYESTCGRYKIYNNVNADMDTYRAGWTLLIDDRYEAEAKTKKELVAIAENHDQHLA